MAVYMQSHTTLAITLPHVWYRHLTKKGHPMLWLVHCRDQSEIRTGKWPENCKMPQGCALIICVNYYYIYIYNSQLWGMQTRGPDCPPEEMAPSLKNRIKITNQTNPLVLIHEMKITIHWWWKHMHTIPSLGKSLCGKWNDREKEKECLGTYTLENR